MYSGHHEKATGNQIKSSETMMLCVPSSPRQFFERLKKGQHCMVDVIAGDANAAAYKYHKKQENQDLCNSSVAVMLMRREVNMNRPFESRLHTDHSTKNHHSQLRSTDFPDCCSVAILSWKNRLDPEL